MDHFCEIISKLGQGLGKSCRLSQLLTEGRMIENDRSQKLTLSHPDR